MCPKCGTHINYVRNYSVKILFRLVCNGMYAMLNNTTYGLIICYGQSTKMMKVISVTSFHDTVQLASTYVAHIDVSS